MSDRKDPELQLLESCRRGELPIVRELFESKAVDPNRVVEKRFGQTFKISGYTYSTVGWTPLHYATAANHLNVVTFLVTTGGADVNSKDKYGYTPLHRACIAGHLHVVTFLVTTGRADVNSKDNYGKTPLHRACEWKHSEIVRWIIYESDAKISDDMSINSVLDWSSKKNQLEEMVQFLATNAKFSIDTTNCVLRWACQEGHLEIVTNLVTSTNADVNSKDNEGQTALHIACANGHLEVIIWLTKNTRVNIEAADDNLGGTALHWACADEHLDVVSYLITTCGASVLATTKDGLTPLHVACHNGYLNVVEYLVTKTNCDVNSKTSNGETPLDIAQREGNNEIVKLLANHMNIDVDLSEPQSEQVDQQPLTDDELRILKIILAEHIDKLSENKLGFDLALPGELKITKKMVVDGLHLIGQTRISKILDKKQGIKDLQDYVFTNVYQDALRNEQHQISMQVFRMILCGIPRTGKTTFWKRLAKVKGFQPSEISPSTSALECHMMSANKKKDATSPHLESAMLFDLHLYEDTSDLKKEALTIYKHILATKQPKSETKESAQTKTSLDLPSIQAKTADERTKIADETASSTEKVLSPVSLPKAAVINESDPISQKIEEYFEELNTLLKSGKNLPDIPLIKKICSLADIGGQRAFLEMLPTVTIGKALYLLFFSYENFETKLSETVQMKDNPMEICTGTQYKQMEVIMQSLICVSTTSKISSNNVALLVGTHVDKVEPKDVDRVNGIIQENVKPFLDNETLVYAKKSELARKSELVLEVSIQPNSRCSDNPEDYQEVIMNLVEKRLKCSESENLPASWYMFSIVLRRMQLAGHSVLQYSHCELIAKRLHIKKMQLQSLLSRMHKILGIVIYFPEVEQLKDTVICDPAVVYKSISELIFNSFDETSHPKLCKRLKKWGVFLTKELKEQCKVQKGCQLQLDKLIILLQHLGIIAPVNVIKSVDPDAPLAKPEHQDNTEHSIHPQYLIPCILDDAKHTDLNVNIHEAQMCSIIPLRIYFSCGFAPMGGFCYLFTRLLTNNHDKGWQLLLPDIFNETTKNDIYWRNKVTFKVDKNYFVTLLSTHEYYEIHIHITYSGSKRPFQLGSDGHRVCKKVWDAVSNVLLNSLNEPLQHYITACECITHRGNEDYDGHMMTFSHNPDDAKPLLTALCLKDKAMPATVEVDDTKQSVVIWFKEPRVCQTTDLGKAVELSIDLMFKVKNSDEKLQYQWLFDDEEIEDDNSFSISNKGVLSIHEFEKDHEGKYRCIVSTTSQPVMSVLTEVQLNLTAPPDIFDPKMKRNKFSLFLNANGISYEVCKLLKRCKITADRFNFRSYEVWSQKVQSLLEDEPAFKNLIVLCHCPPHTGLSIKHGLPTSADIFWKPLPAGEQNTVITGYTVQVVGADTEREISVTDANATSVEVPNLRPSTLYTFNVCAMTKSGKGPIATITSTTPKALCHYPPHTGLSIKHRLPTTAEISWKPLPEGEQNTVITGYTVQAVGPGTEREIPVTDANATSVVVPNLRPSTLYTFNVCAMTKAGKGPLTTITSTTPKETATTDQCPVCRNIQVDPCTLQCGHATCQLCLAKMWKHCDTTCPICKAPWQVLPAISIDFRDNIESTHGSEVAQLRCHYTEEDKEVIEKFLIARKSHRQDTSVQKLNGQMLQEEANQRELQITQQPQSNTNIKYGETVTLCVSAVGAENLSYNWKKNGDDFIDSKCNGFDTATLTINNFIPNDQGKYSCVIKNCNASIESQQTDMALGLQILEHPKSMAYDYHGHVSLSVSGIGPGPLSYKWMKDGVGIVDEDYIGVDEPTLTIGFFSLKHAGKYSCKVKHDQMTVESDTANLELNPHILNHPQETSINVKYGESMTLNVSAIGSGQLHYNWKKNGQDITDSDDCTGTDTAALTITSFTEENQGQYTCIVKNHIKTVESSATKLKLKLELISDPQTDTNIKHGEDITLTVSAVGPRPLSYKWIKDGVDISDAKCIGADTDTLTITSFSSENQGNYSCIVSGDQQSVESKPALLELDLQILDQPQANILCKHRTQAVLSVSAVGNGPLSYKWKKDGKEITRAEFTGISTDTLIITSFLSSHQGIYVCLIQDNHKSVTSKPTNLALNLRITKHPQSNTNIKYKEKVTLTVSTIEVDNLSYNWKKDGEDISGSKYTGTDTPILTISNFSPENQGKYSCVVKNNYDYSSIESQKADLVLDFQILEHPKSMACNYLAQVSLSVSAIGPGPLSYKWKKDGVDIVDEEYTGVNKPTLSIRSFMLKHEGNYVCEVKRNEKSIESVPAKLDLNIQITEQPQESSIISYGESVTLCVSAAGSGQLYYKWKKDGKDITNPKYTGIDTASLTINSFSDMSQGEYMCVVKNDSNTIQSNPARLELKLQIKNHPQESTSIKQGEDVTLTMSAVGPQPLTYKWMKDREEISDVKSTDKLTIVSFSNRDQGNYSCIVRGGQQSIESKPASLGLDLQILQQPQSNLLCKYGDKIVLSVSVVGCGSLSYEWKKDGEGITHPECTGTNSDKLNISYFTNMHEGSYSCVVKDNHKTLKSERANLALNLIILSHPQSKTCEFHALVSLSVSAIGAGHLDYKWKKDGKDVTDPGYDTATLTIISFSSSYVGKYTCTVTDSHRTVESDPAQLSSPSTQSIATQGPSFDQAPTLDELMILKYADKGEKKKVRIINTASHKWRDLASLICDDAHQISVLEQKCQNNPNECLRQLFIHNFIDKKPQKYSQDWSGLIELLDDIGLEAVAKEVEHAIKSFAHC